MTAARWRFFVDRGGTFTDCIAISPDGSDIRVGKLLSTDDAPQRAIRTLCGLRATDPIPPCELRLGTTLVTNALLERRGRPTALAITAGFADLPHIGDQSRSDIFTLEIAARRPLAKQALEVTARAAADGSVLARDDPAELAARLTELRTAEIDSLAVVVLHGHRAPQLEREIANIARAVGFTHVTCSHEVSLQTGLLARTDTATLDAYTTPLLRAYLDGLAADLPGSTIALMQSSGGLAEWERFRGKDAIVSGPAGGVVAGLGLARAHGLAGAIGFDMGGTSTDVVRVGTELEHVWETRIADVTVRTPVLAVHTIAAGGGSICRFDGLRLTVGPDSAGADPGPLCYGRPEANTLALTDAALALGRLVPERFPLELDHCRVDRALHALAAAMDLHGDDRALVAAEGCFRVAVHAMADAIRRVTIERGHDVRDQALVVFGGAGGQAACAVARALGIRVALVHPHAGVLSAWGIGMAHRTWHDHADLGDAPLSCDALARALAVAHAAVERGLAVLSGTPNAPTTRVLLELHYEGSDTTLALAPDDANAVAAEFQRRHASELGWTRDASEIRMASVRVALIWPSTLPRTRAPVGRPVATPLRTGSLFDGGCRIELPILAREDLGAGAELVGPAMIVDQTSQLVVEPGWTASVADDGTLVLRDISPMTAPTPSTLRDPVTLEIFGHRFMAIAEQMGVVLRRGAQSTNIRERLDFSCAVFDDNAGLVANAPHLPVHLGAMGESVAHVAARHPDARPGDVFATNDPEAGGSHLPDITVVTPVFVGERLTFWVASRGHHADVGGTAPGSMPPDSTSLMQEGVVLSAMPIVQGGRLREREILDVLTAGPYPARRPGENLADLRAQIAANAAGATALVELAGCHGVEVVRAYMGHVQDHAATAVRKTLARLPCGTTRWIDRNDDGLAIEVAIEVGGARTRIDFTGTAPAVAGNLNAPRAVTIAAVLYVLRALVGEPIPLNAGCMRAIELVIPPGSLLDPPAGAAVAGGNVETSQRIVDVLLAAFGRKAASCGTMNNLTFGDDSFGYYETIAGGEGACDGHIGASGVQTHMTNTRITDPEILESRFPVRLLGFSIRRGSGGAGRFAGGDGLVRSFEFRAPLRVSILSDRRSAPPFGLVGGEPGALGRNLLDERVLPGRCGFAAEIGTRLVIETPGGGGYGPPERGSS